MLKNLMSWSGVFGNSLFLNIFSIRLSIIGKTNFSKGKAFLSQNPEEYIYNLEKFDNDIRICHY